MDVTNEGNISNEENCDSDNVNKLDGLFFAVILETVLLQMKILECYNKLRHNNNGFNKLSKDSLMLIEIIRQTLIQLVTSGEWSSLSKTTKEFNSKTLFLEKLRHDHNELMQMRENIMNELNEKRNEYNQELYIADEKVSILKDLLQDTIMNISARLLYADKWLAARAQILELRTPVPCSSLPQVSQIQRVHDELVKAYNLQVKDLEAKGEYWRIRYANDTAKINQNLADRREQLRITKARREELQDVYNLHAGEMRAWLTFKKERAARRAREERTRNAAIQIQAWWRGVMVRRALGSFRYLRNVTKKAPTKTKKKN